MAQVKESEELIEMRRQRRVFTSVYEYLEMERKEDITFQLKIISCLPKRYTQIFYSDRNKGRTVPDDLLTEEQKA